MSQRRLVRSILFAAGLVSALLSGSARATVWILSDGRGAEPASILVHSGIRRGDLEAFEQAAEQLSRTARARINGVPLITVELDSPGGDVVEAVRIGQVISERSMMTLVRPGQECVSACVFVLIAGAVHTPADGTEIGVHRPEIAWASPQLSSAEVRQRYHAILDDLHRYMLGMGVSDEAYEIMMSVRGRLHDFTPAELDRFRVRGVSPAWEDALARTWAGQNRTDQRTRALFANLPTLTSTDETWRRMIFMPSAIDRPFTSAAFMRAERTVVHWFHAVQSGDGWDDRAVVTRALAALLSCLADLWLPLVLLACELLRGQLNPWPDGGSMADRWRGW